jgi:polyisoprenyl-phosphate glycosyltransferase
MAQILLNITTAHRARLSQPDVVPIGDSWRVDSMTNNTIQVPEISVVAPAYRCRDCIPELYRRLVDTLDRITNQYEIIFIDDGSPQNDWEVIFEIARSDPRVKGIKLSRNYGQHYAITAGLDHAFGKWVVVMDCDLQDQPEEIQKLYYKALQGYDVVLARRHQRRDSTYRKLSSRLFGWLYNVLGDIQLDTSVANFSISSSRVIACVRQFRESSRCFPIFLNAVGFPRTYIDVEHAVRFAGDSSYDFVKLLDLAIQCIVSRSNKPLRLSIRFGFLLAFLSILGGVVFVARYFLFGVSVPGWTSLAVLISFLGGLGFANMGILGLYLGKVFDEVKGRPLYCVEAACNFERSAVAANQTNESIHLHGGRRTERFSASALTG